MASPAALQGLTATQQANINNAITYAVNTSNLQKGATFGTIENNFNAYLTNPANDAGPNPDGLQFRTSNIAGATGQGTTLAEVDAAFSSVEAHGAGFFEQGNTPSVFTNSWIQQVDRLFQAAPAAAPAPVPTPAPAVRTTQPIARQPAPVAAAPVAIAPAAPAYTTGAPLPVAAPSLPATVATPAVQAITDSAVPTPAAVAAGVTGNPATTTTTTATTGQNLASAAPGTVLGDLLSALTSGSSGSTALGQSNGVSLPPSTILPDTSGGGTATGGSTASGAASSSLSTEQVIIYGVIASLIAAAIWWVVAGHKGGNPLPKIGESIKHAI